MVNTPKIGLINLQELKAYKPRADFVKGLVSAGGIDTVQSEGCYSSKDALAYVADTKLPIYCVCGSDDAYGQLAEQIVADLKASNPDTTVYLAGKQAEELETVLQAAGVKEFLPRKIECNIYFDRIIRKAGGELR